MSGFTNPQQRFHIGQPDRRDLNRSLVDLEHFFATDATSAESASSALHHSASSPLAASTGVTPTAGGTLRLFGKQSSDAVDVSDAHSLPMNVPLRYGDGDVVVERVSENIVILSTDNDERVVRLHPATRPVDAPSPADDEDDSPLLLRRGPASPLLGGEAVRLCATAPVRASEVHAPSRIETGYVMVTNYRLCFVLDRVLGDAQRVDEAALLGVLATPSMHGMFSFPLGYVRATKTRAIIPFNWDELDAGMPPEAFAAAQGPTPAPSAAAASTAAAAPSTSSGPVNRTAHTMLTVELVDGRVLDFEVSNTHLTRNEDLVRSLLHVLANSHKHPFAFSYNPPQGYTVDGWSIYNCFRELRRQFQPAAAVLVFDEDAPANSVIGAQAGKIRPTEWRMADVSELCPTYPTHIAVPRHVTDAQLALIARFRTHGRVPALAYLHAESGAALVRCSQPRAGIKQLRCEDDEFYFREMLRRNPGGERMVIFDARPFLNAAWNRGVKGAGYESEEHYNCRVQFLDIPNVHRVKDAHEALVASLYSTTPSTSNPSSGIMASASALPPAGGDGARGDANDGASRYLLRPAMSMIGMPTGGVSTSPAPRGAGPLDGPEEMLDPQQQSEWWLSMISKLLDGAIRIAMLLKEGVCVVVHCSDGWDRTPQLTALAMLLSDPWYRTLMGLQVLIEYQWIHFGHKFASRLAAHGSERSPVFLQFLDCVWQLWRQQPMEFEFNEAFLFSMARHLHSGRFGTFTCDSIRERSERWQPATQSYWSHVNTPAAQQAYRQHDFRNEHASAPVWASAAAATSARSDASAKPAAATAWQSTSLKVCRNLHLFFH